MTKLNFAIVGCGTIARTHIEAIASSGDAHVTVLVDKFEPRARRLADSFHVASVADDYRKVIGKVDAAVVALPHHLHAPIAIDLLQQGVHVLVEKPMALNTSDCDAMMKAASGAGTILAVGLARRFFASAQFVKQVLETQLLGDIISFDFREGAIYKWPIASDFAFRKEKGGGVLADTGVHILDLLLWWLGGYDSLAYSDDALGGVEANCEIHLELQNGATGVVELSRTRDLRNTCVIQGERGIIEVETNFNSRIRLKIKDQDLALTGRAIVAGMTEESLDDIFSRQLEDFVAAIRSKRKPSITGQEGRRSVELIAACYALRQPLKQPWMFLNDAQRGDYAAAP